MKNARLRAWAGGLLAAAAVGLFLSQIVLSAPGPTGQVEGTIAAVERGIVIVATRAGGQVRITVTGDTLIIRRKRVNLEDIKPNELVGVTARRETDGSLTAISINVFPPQYKGRVREAQFVMNTGDIMTNATVFQNVRRIEGRVLYLKLPDGTAVIAVPKEAAVFRLTVIKPGDLKPGMQVIVRGTTGADGTFVARTITVVTQ